METRAEKIAKAIDELEEEFRNRKRVMEAFGRGADIESQPRHGLTWKRVTDPSWNWRFYRYRVAESYGWINVYPGPKGLRYGNVHESYGSAFATRRDDCVGCIRVKLEAGRWDGECSNEELAS